MKASETLDFREMRKRIGDANSATLSRLGGTFRRKLRLAFDTQVYQHCANELAEIECKIVQSGPWSGIEEVRVTTVPANKPSGKGYGPNELECIYALCELGRRGDAEILDLPVIRQERNHSRHEYYDGLERLDFDVPYLEYPIICSKMRRVSARFMTSEVDGCLRDVAHYAPMIQHLTGAGQLRDVAAFMEADMANVDVFVSLDGRFIRPFRDIEAKLRRSGVQTFVMRPSELCHLSELQPIPFPQPNARQSMGASPPER